MDIETIKQKMGKIIYNHFKADCVKLTEEQLKLVVNYNNKQVNLEELAENKNKVIEETSIITIGSALYPKRYTTRISTTEYLISLDPINIGIVVEREVYNALPKYFDTDELVKNPEAEKKEGEKRLQSENILSTAINLLVNKPEYKFTREIYLQSTLLKNLEEGKELEHILGIKMEEN